MSKSIKDIRRKVNKQIKKVYPNFNKLTKNEKKQVINEIWDEIYSTYDFSSDIKDEKHELLNIDNIPKDIITIDAMKDLIKNTSFHNHILPFISKKTYIKDPELKDIYNIVDWGLVNYLLVEKNFCPGRREILPVQYFKAELLKHLKYPELSYRKYTGVEINNPERKENRAFIGLRIGQKISHIQLSQFRSSISYKKLVNVMVYFLCLFLEKKPLSTSTFYAVDSTELAAKISPYPLFKIKVGDKYIRFYQDIDADLGTRRNKRDKSKFVVGYRLHTLTVIDADTEQAFPLLSILSAANHHDSNFLEILVDFGKKIGLDLNIIATDQAYGEKEESEEIKNKHNVIVLNAPKEKTKLPDFVDEKTYSVRKDYNCAVDMEYCGKDEKYGHEFHCAAQFGECPYEGNCDKIRYIAVDSGAFGQIPMLIDNAKHAISMRKVAERPFNLIKHRDGLEPLRTKGQHKSTVVATVANITTLLIEIAGYRKKRSKKKPKNQLSLFEKAA